jgi:Prephenate dehydrogenase
MNGTATDLEESIKAEIIKFPVSGFRDFTRIAASDPVMWRDIFLQNREGVLEIIQRFNAWPPYSVRSAGAISSRTCSPAPARSGATSSTPTRRSP